MPNYHCISGLLEEMHLRDQEKKFLHRYNRLRIRSGKHMITIHKLQIKRKWKREKQQRARLNCKKDWGEELKRMRMMTIMVKWNRLRVRNNLPPLDCHQVQEKIYHRKLARGTLNRLRYLNPD